MALDTFFCDLQVHIRKVGEDLAALDLTIEDRPQEPESALVDQLQESVVDLRGLLAEAEQAAQVARKALGPPLSLESARRQLAICETRIRRAQGAFWNELLLYEKVKALLQLGTQGHEWQKWSHAVKDAIERCRPSLEEADDAVAGCWQEMVEHLTVARSISSGDVGEKT